jgi:hypothetical protein
MTGIDLDRLLKLRAVVARFGEMDGAKWWSTKGQLGRYGALALRRGFPRTHRFAQARAVFAVADHRCREVFDPPGCVTLWHLPEVIEESFDARWEHWLEHPVEWEPFFQKLEGATAPDLLSVLRSFDLIGDHEAQAFARLRRSAEGNAVMLSALFEPTDEAITTLAIGFARGEPEALAVPYARRGDA